MTAYDIMPYKLTLKTTIVVKHMYTLKGRPANLTMPSNSKFKFNSVSGLYKKQAVRALTA